MKLSATALIPRRAFLALGLAAVPLASPPVQEKTPRGAMMMAMPRAMLPHRRMLLEKRAAATGITISQYQVLSTPSQGRSAE